MDPVRVTGCPSLNATRNRFTAALPGFLAGDSSPCFAGLGMTGDLETRENNIRRAEKK
jgi:hypothetical protein